MDKPIEKRFTIAGIGELLWDVLEDSEKLGGAPINFAYHCRSFGAEAYAISSIGKDRRGKAALEELDTRGVATAHITEIGGVATGYVLANVDEAGVASYNFPEDVAWDRIQINQNTRKLAGTLDAICYGSLAQRSEISRRSILEYLDLLAPEALSVFDLNIRQNFYSEAIIRTSLEKADVLKLNDDEIKIIAEVEDLAGDEEEQLKMLVRRYSLKLGVLTRGGSGSLLVSPSSVSNHPGYRTEIVDTIGAGDSFTAVTVCGLLNKYPLDKINDHANRVAAFVCSRKGAMVELSEELKNF